MFSLDGRVAIVTGASSGLGAVFVVGCDILARTLRAPYEIPLSVVVGIVGAALFLWLLLRRRSRAH